MIDLFIAAAGGPDHMVRRIDELLAPTPAEFMAASPFRPRCS